MTRRVKRISANGAWRGATVDRITWLITAGWSAARADGWLLGSFGKRRSVRGWCCRRVLWQRSSCVDGRRGCGELLSGRVGFYAHARLVQVDEISMGSDRGATFFRSAGRGRGPQISIDIDVFDAQVRRSTNGSSPSASTPALRRILLVPAPARTVTTPGEGPRVSKWARARSGRGVENGP